MLLKTEIIAVCRPSATYGHWAVAIILTAIADSNILGKRGKRTKYELFGSFLEPNNPNPCTFF